ncbi:phytanoyl-CoA dioxygenase family protein [Candidatus Poribacteria bacterium]|nr:phytanoyl-CoA dioxygenase family protein [Candidatus Poribacteria bacterium]
MHSETPFIDCTSLIENRTLLLEHVHKNGYLYFPALLPVDPVIRLRQQVFNVANQHNLLESDSDPIDGIRKEGVFICEQDGTETFRRFYIDVQKLRLFHALPHHKRIIDILEILFDSAVFIHPRHICHVIFPGEYQYTTPPHQDFHPVRGTQDTWTVWTPLGDCNTELGGLAIACGSNRSGFLNDNEVRSWKILDDNTQWVWNPFKCGDVVMFHSLTIHRGRDNVTNNRIRLATSARYQSVNDPIDEDALTVHLGCARWEELYDGWDTSDPLKYYWKAIDLNVQPAYHRRKK